MQLIPKNDFGSLGGTYFRDLKAVLFMFKNGDDDALTSLTRSLNAGFVSIFCA